MNLGQLLEAVLTLTHKTQGEVADAIGVSRQSFSRSMSTGSMKWNTFMKAMDYLGYEIVLRPKVGTMEVRIGSLGEE